MTAKVIQGSFLGGQPKLAAVQSRIAAPPPIQAKIAAPAPATAFAGRPPGPPIPAFGARPSGPPAPAFAERPGAVQRHGAGGAFAVDSGALGLASGGGKPLPDSIRGQMEAALGADFSNVRVHVGPQAERIGAIAFTVGSDIYFAPGRYQPDTVHGQQLLGHELTHVVQQRAGRVRNPVGSGLAVVQDHALEAEADRLGQRAAMHRVAAQAKMPPGAAQPAAPVRVSPPVSAGPGSYRLTAGAGGRPVGSVMVHALDKGAVEVTDLHVDEAQRGHGIGKMLLASAARTGQKFGRSKVTLAAQDNGSGHLTRWYKDMGFAQVGVNQRGYPQLEAPISGVLTGTVQRSRQNIDQDMDYTVLAAGKSVQRMVTVNSPPPAPVFPRPSRPGPSKGEMREMAQQYSAYLQDYHDRWGYYPWERGRKRQSEYVYEPDPKQVEKDRAAYIQARAQLADEERRLANRRREMAEFARRAATRVSDFNRRDTEQIVNYGEAYSGIIHGNRLLLEHASFGPFASGIPVGRGIEGPYASANPDCADPRVQDAFRDWLRNRRSEDVQRGRVERDIHLQFYDDKEPCHTCAHNIPVQSRLDNTPIELFLADRVDGAGAYHGAHYTRTYRPGRGDTFLTVRGRGQTNQEVLDRVMQKLDQISKKADAIYAQFQKLSAKNSIPPKKLRDLVRGLMQEMDAVLISLRNLQRDFQGIASWPLIKKK